MFGKQDCFKWTVQGKISKAQPKVFIQAFLCLWLIRNFKGDGGEDEYYDSYNIGKVSWFVSCKNKTEQSKTDTTTILQIIRAPYFFRIIWRLWSTKWWLYFLRRPQKCCTALKRHEYLNTKRTWLVTNEVANSLLSSIICLPILYPGTLALVLM